MLYRFCYEMQIGDYVVYPSKPTPAAGHNLLTGSVYVSQLHAYK